MTLAQVIYICVVYHTSRAGAPVAEEGAVLYSLAHRRRSVGECAAIILSLGGGGWRRLGNCSLGDGSLHCSTFLYIFHKSAVLYPRSTQYTLSV